MAADKKVHAKVNHRRCPVLAEMVGKRRVMAEGDFVGCVFEAVSFKRAEPAVFLLTVGRKIDKAAVFLVVIFLILARVDNYCRKRTEIEGEVIFARFTRQILDSLCAEFAACFVVAPCVYNGNFTAAQCKRIFKHVVDEIALIYHCTLDVAEEHYHIGLIRKIRNRI